MLGDDATDEDAIAAAQALGGLGVKVGPGPSAARLRAPDPAAVRAWLAREAALTERRFATPHRRRAEAASAEPLCRASFWQNPIEQRGRATGWENLDSRPLGASPSGRPRRQPTRQCLREREPLRLPEADVRRAPCTRARSPEGVGLRGLAPRHEVRSASAMPGRGRRLVLASSLRTRALASCIESGPPASAQVSNGR